MYLVLFVLFQMIFFGLFGIYNSSLVWFTFYNLDPPGLLFSFYFVSFVEIC